MQPMNSQLMLTAINIAEGPLLLSLWRPIGGTIYLQLQVLRVGQRRTDQDRDAEITRPHRDGAAVSRLLDPSLKRDDRRSGCCRGFDRFCGKGFGGIERSYCQLLR